MDSPWEGDIEAVEDASCVLCFDSLKTRADDVLEQALRIRKEVDYLAVYYAKGQTKVLDPHEQSSVTHTSPLWYHLPWVPRLDPRALFPPLEFKTTQWRGRKIAVYSLYDLLGEEKLRALLQGTRYEGVRCVVMKHARQNVPAEKLLLKLQCYLAQSGP